MKFHLSGAACLLVLALAPLASAQTAAKPETTTFTGRCHYEGVIQFADPLGGVPEQNTMTLAARAVCSGWLDGRRVDGAQGWIYTESEGLMSCTEGLPAGSGWLIIDGTAIDVTSSEIRLTGVGKVEFRGTAGGSLHGIGASDDDSAEQVERCTEGDGSLDRVSVFADVAGSISG